MKKTLLIAALLFIVALSGFTIKPDILNCYLSFKKATDLSVSPPERFNLENDHTRKLNTEKGDVALTILDGYRILYNNKHHMPFVNLKVELSKPESYQTDQRNLLDNLNYINSNSDGMETRELIELNYNGYKIYGLSRNSMETGRTLGIFVMFPGNNTLVYFYFNNALPAYRSFQSLEEYRAQRNAFLGEYTAHLKSCKANL